VLLTTAITEVELNHPKETPSYHTVKARDLTYGSIDETKRAIGKEELIKALFNAAAHLCIAADKLLTEEKETSHVRSR
jgi:hypothetical protein